MITAPSMLSYVQEYLDERRRLGFALTISGTQLLNFARFADRVGHHGPLTVQLVMNWAQQKARRTTGQGDWKSSARLPNIARRSSPAQRSSTPTFSVTSGGDPHPISTPQQRSQTCWPRLAGCHQQGRCCHSPMRRSSD